MQDNRKTGKVGEDLARQYLENKGYKILEKNFKCKLGEIDIIAQDKNEIVFVEVKSRNVLTYGKPAEAIDNIKIKHIYKTSEYYLLIHKKLNENIRIDVIEIYFDNQQAKINHIKKAIIDRI